MMLKELGMNANQFNILLVTVLYPKYGSLEAFATSSFDCAIEKLQEMAKRDKTFMESCIYQGSDGVMADIQNKIVSEVRFQKLPFIVPIKDLMSMILPKLEVASIEV